MRTTPSTPPLPRKRRDVEAGIRGGQERHADRPDVERAVATGGASITKYCIVVARARSAYAAPTDADCLVNATDDVDAVTINGSSGLDITAATYTDVTMRSLLLTLMTAPSTSTRA